MYWRDKIQPELNKFNIALQMVNASNPTGMDQQQKVNMAIAIHLGKMDCMNYKYKDFNCHEWLYYLAWDVIQSTAKISPPKPGKVAGVANAASIANVASIANAASIADGADIGEDNVDVESMNENESMMNVMVTMKVALRGSSKRKKGAEQDAKHKKEVKEKTKEIRKLRKLWLQSRVIAWHVF